MSGQAGSYSCHCKRTLEKGQSNHPQDKNLCTEYVQGSQAMAFTAGAMKTMAGTRVKKTAVNFMVTLVGLNAGNAGNVERVDREEGFI